MYEKVKTTKGTIMIVDNKATAKKSYEAYKIDRRVYRTMDDLKELVEDCMSENVYLIRIYENGNQILEVRS